jgi:AcrR family transcriptional regulator
VASPPRTLRSERTREALRRAALARFLSQGFDVTTTEEVAADAGVTLRTFYRHFTSKQDLLFADYDEGLHWFRRALLDRPASESIDEAVSQAIFAFPYDYSAVTDIAAMRAQSLDDARITDHIRRVELDFAQVVEERLRRTDEIAGTADRDLLIVVRARTTAAAVFAAMEVWMHSDHPTLDQLARVCRLAVQTIR